MIPVLILGGEQNWMANGRSQRRTVDSMLRPMGTGLYFRQCKVPVKKEKPKRKNIKRVGW